MYSPELMEKSFIITFETRDPAIVSKVTDAIKLIGRWWNYIDNIWIVRTDSSARTIKTYLNVFLQNNEKIIVLGLDGDVEWIGLDKNATSWLTNYLK